MYETNILAVSRLILRPDALYSARNPRSALEFSRLPQLDPSYCGESDHGQQSRPA